METSSRVSRLREVLVTESLDAILVSSVWNVTYLSGFTGDDSLALVGADSLQIITDFRYVEQVEQECPGWEVICRKKSMWPAVGEVLAEGRVKRLGFETGHVTYRDHVRLSQGADGVELVGLESAVEKLRLVKDAEEVRAIESAIEVQEAAFAPVREELRAGMTEKEIARELDHRMRCHGADSSAFPTIVATGERASLPHARATERMVQQGDAILIDWGARRFLYNSDLTRVLHLGTVTTEFSRIYEIVRQAQDAALAAIRPGVTFSEVDGAARSFITERGYGEQFGHSLGHGLGLEIHESPVVREGNEEPLEPGMVFTVEPGIYIPGWGGVRIEDVVVVSREGVRILSSLGKDLDGVQV